MGYPIDGFHAIRHLKISYAIITNENFPFYSGLA
jgi:hypothetical protein